MGIRSEILMLHLEAGKLACPRFLNTDRGHEISGQRQKTSFLLASSHGQPLLHASAIWP